MTGDASTHTRAPAATRGVQLRAVKQEEAKRDYKLNMVVSISSFEGFEVLFGLLQGRCRVDTVIETICLFL